MKKLITTLALLVSAPSYAAVPETILKADVIRVYDGDTVDVMAYPWPDFNPTTSIRLLGIDTPELRGKCEKEKELAIKAKKYLESILTKQVTLKGVRYGKYAGRHLGEIITSDGVNVSDAMIAAKLARPYNGGKRQGWCS